MRSHLVLQQSSLLAYIVTFSQFGIWLILSPSRIKRPRREFQLKRSIVIWIPYCLHILHPLDL